MAISPTTATARRTLPHHLRVKKYLEGHGDLPYDGHRLLRRNGRGPWPITPSRFRSGFARPASVITAERPGTMADNAKPVQVWLRPPSVRYYGGTAALLGQHGHPGLGPRSAARTRLPDSRLHAPRPARSSRPRSKVSGPNSTPRLPTARSSASTVIHYGYMRERCGSRGLRVSSRRRLCPSGFITDICENGAVVGGSGYRVEDVYARADSLRIYVAAGDFDIDRLATGFARACPGDCNSIDLLRATSILTDWQPVLRAHARATATPSICCGRLRPPAPPFADQPGIATGPAGAANCALPAGAAGTAVRRSARHCHRPRRRR